MMKGLQQMLKPTQSSVDYGKELEKYIAQKFIEIGFENARRSNGSGNKGEAGDIAGQSLAVAECKHYNTKNITIKEDVWKKLNSEIPLHSTRIPMYFLQNGSDLRLAVMDVDDLFNLIEGLYNGKR